MPLDGPSPARLSRQPAWFVGALSLLVLPATAVGTDFPATWQTVPDLPVSVGVSSFQPVQIMTLPNGDGLVLQMSVPQSSPAQVLRYDAANLVWRSGQAMPGSIAGTSGSGAVVLADGRVLVVAHNKTFLYDPTQNLWQTRAAFPGPVDWPLIHIQLIPLSNGDVLAFGLMTSMDSRDGRGPRKETFRYRMDRNAWEPGPQTAPSGFSRMILMPSGKLAGVGGDCIWMCDPVTLEWSSIGNTHSYGGSSPLYLVGSEALYTCKLPSGTRKVMAINANLTPPAYLLAENSAENEYNSCHNFTVFREGQDWFGMVRPVTVTTKEKRLEVDLLSGRNPGQWTRLPNCPTTTTGTNDTYSFPQTNGILVFWHANGKLRSQLLRVQSSAPRSPAVANLGPITVVEGSSATFTYTVTGDLPSGGVEVLVERVAGGGNGDIQVVDGMVQRVMSRSDVKTVRLAARTDTNSETDTAWVRVRIVQTDKSIDPNARTFTVTIPDRYTQPQGLVGDVNGDGLINAVDLDEVISHFGSKTDER